jgi:hypothetical protein
MEQRSPDEKSEAVGEFDSKPGAGSQMRLG